MNDSTFFVPGKPVGKGRPRITMHGSYTPKRTREYEALVRECYQRECRSIVYHVPLAVTIDAAFTIPKSVSKKDAAALAEEHWYTKKPDADNVIKIVLDALNGTAYPDDNLVSSIVCMKHYCQMPEEEGITVTISEIEGGTSWISKLLRKLRKALTKTQ